MSNSPIAVKRAGNLKATILENTNSKGQIYHAVDISRSYHDEGGQWHETTQFFTEQLPQARLVADTAYAFIHERLNELKAERKNDQQQKADEDDKAAPAKKRGRKKTHVEKLEAERETTSKAK